MDHALADIRLAVRSLIRRPGLALAAVASVGIGLAATTAVFSVINAALFKPVPGVTRPERLVEIARAVGGETADVTWQVYDRLRQQTAVLEDVAALQLTQVAILDDEEPVRRGALAVTANYFGRALSSARDLQPAWDIDGVLVATVDLELNGTPEEAGRAFQRALRERIATLPGVEAVAFAAKLPMGGRSSFGPTYAAGSDPRTSAGVDASVNRVTPGYFRSMGLSLRGRDFIESDAESAPLVAIVNETMARQLFPGAEPVGRRFFLGQGQSRREFEVIGVAADARLALPGQPGEPQYHVPQTQFYNSSSVLHVRVEPAHIAAAPAFVHAAIRDVMPTLPVPPLRPMSEALEVFLLPQHIATWVAGTMAFFGLILAAIGVYGVTAYAASRRGKEIGIRLALGAGPRQLARLLLWQGARAPLAGTVFGLVAGGVIAFVVSMLGVIRGVDVVDPVVALVAPSILVGVTLAAMSAPVRRAIRRPAMSALRDE